MWRVYVLVLCLLSQTGLVRCDGSNSANADSVAQPGGAGYALAFRDTVIIKTDFKDFPTTQMTFEAWLSTSDFCHQGAVMSYSIPTDSNDIEEITKAANHFVIFDVKNIIACHDFEFIDIVPDYVHASCHGHYNRTMADFSPTTGPVYDREGKWKHLAITWNSEENGETLVYIDGTLVGRAYTWRKDPIKGGGAFMLGGEQDCYAGCTDSKQGYYGLMDEVRIWNIARKQNEIVKTMRAANLDLPESNLVAYWKFDDPGSEGYEQSGTVADASGHGNHLDLLVPPIQTDVFIEKDGKTLDTGSLRFRNNYAMNQGVKGMPSRDFTIEFWARTSKVQAGDLKNERYSEFLSFATIREGDHEVGNDNGFADTSLVDDAIRIERYLTEYNETSYITNGNINTLGSISIHINSNRQGNGRFNDNWLDYATNWVDDNWHHLAVTWEYSSGETRFYFDGKEVIPFWRAQYGIVTQADPTVNGVDKTLAANAHRSSSGSLVIGQNQECMAGCFSPSSAYDGSMANLRIWDRVLSTSEIQNNMFKNEPSDDTGLIMNFLFTQDYMKGEHERNRRIVDSKGNHFLVLGSVAPSFHFSTVPLSDQNGKPVEGPTPGYMGHSLALSDKQLLMVRDFADFPSEEITVEFWMQSLDTCREGVPFSYADGQYQDSDNSFLIFNYLDWGIAVMEDEGHADDHNAGFGSTDGKWHHIAVTWESKTGKTVLYDNAYPQWIVQRAKGKKILGGGTLVIGREQDCLGGCFDSLPGAYGDIQTTNNLEYGPQDFYGLIEEMRVWKRARTPEEIRKGMIHDKDTGAGKENTDISNKDPDLVAWWKFDEGQGYTVKDETGQGHDLRIMSEPDWVVAKWTDSCGDSVLGIEEECDDGNRIDGDGCDKYCTIENGYSCTASGPSICIRNDKAKDSKEKVNQPKTSRSTPTKDPKKEQQHRENTGQNVKRTSIVEEAKTGTHKKKRSGVATFFLVLFVMALIGLVLFAIYKKRETIYEYAPGVRTMVNGAQDRINAAFGRGYARYDLAAVDPEETYVSPGFVDSQPPEANRASGGNVPYEPIRDVGPESRN